MPGTSEAERPFFSGLRRWLRGSCLSRIPLLRRFFRPCKPQPAPRPLRRRTALGGDFLEDRNVPDYLYALAQTALVGEAALYVAASLRTPEQVLLLRDRKQATKLAEEVQARCLQQLDPAGAPGD